VIDGVAEHPLRQICDDRGKVLHMLRRTDPYFEGFGEVYFSLTYPGIVKAWNRHKRVNLFYAVPIGRAKIVLYDDREGSVTRGQVEEHYLGPENYVLLRIPAGLWYGFQAVGAEPCLIADVIPEPHDPTEAEKLPVDASEIPYHRWRNFH